MKERIEELTDLVLNGKMTVNPIATEFDREDLFLPENIMQVKRICEYILNQEPKITKYSRLTGFFKFDGSVVGDAFVRNGHKHTGETMALFYLKPINNLSTMEWQHATGDYGKLLKKVSWG